MAEVWIAERSDGLPARPVAIKLPRRGCGNQLFCERLARERDILDSLNHPNIARLLDAGASGITAPMITSAEDAQAFVKTTKYPPLGDRSWGPSLALNHTGLSADDYLKNANALTVAIAMVETRAALEAIDDILGVAGIDGIFIGPSDLSIALSNGDQVAPNAAEIDSAMQHAVSRCRAHGKFACAFAGDGERAGELLKFGFDLVIAGAETAQLRSGARRAINAARRIASA